MGKLLERSTRVYGPSASMQAATLRWIPWGLVKRAEMKRRLFRGVLGKGSGVAGLIAVVSGGFFKIWRAKQGDGGVSLQCGADSELPQCRQNGGIDRSGGPRLGEDLGNARLFARQLGSGLCVC